MSRLEMIKNSGTSAVELANLFAILRGEKSRLLETLQWQACGGKRQSLRFLQVPNPEGSNHFPFWLLIPY